MQALRRGQQTMRDSRPADRHGDGLGENLIPYIVHVATNAVIGTMAVAVLR
ncbi:hypothetical protein ACFXPY_18425 [Streptomyces sp. NPDC059153]|uniref:hypothetical protein n=1 Tax=Streptomyces sp. NPDC059153 TaxID=3346743 RepID=UPI00367CA0FA